MKSGKADIDYMKNSPHVPLRQITEEKRFQKTREGAKSGATRLDRMKRGSGIKGRDDKSSSIEIRMTDTLVKINPTDPLILAKQAARRNLNCSDSSGISLDRAEASR